MASALATLLSLRDPPKDIAWVHGLLGTGIVTWDRLEELHAGNPIPHEERVKVEKSMAAVRASDGSLP